ncbi:UNVERIFIED_ORG: hypothetical protein ABID57_001322 [Arthrobacter sp. UYEF1]
MGKIDNLAGDEAAKIWQAIRELTYRTNLNSSAIGRGGMEIYDGGMLTISNGGLSVTGSATVVGTLNADGTINMTGLFIASGEMRLNGTTIATGEFNIDGPLIVDGNTTFNGTLNINGVTTIAGDTTVTGTFNTNGPVNITGLTTLTGDLDVVGAGNIQVGDNMLLLPGVAGGSIQFSSGGGLENTGGVTAVKGAGNAGLIMNTNASIFAASSSIDATPTSAKILAGGKSVEATSAGVTVNGILTLVGYPSTTGTANVFMSAGGVIYKSTSAARFKIDAQPMYLPDSLLGVPVKDWIDRGEHERGEEGPRIPGIIAEEVRDGGGEQFVTYDETGEIQGVMYDRLALARTEILARQLDAALARIAELEA